MSDLATLLRPLITEALIDAVSRNPGLAPPPTAVVEDVMARVAVDPAISHVVNGEPWYRSRVTLGALLSGAMPFVALLGSREVTAEQQGDILEVLTAAGTLIGAGVTLYGRWKAHRPIGR